MGVWPSKKYLSESDLSNDESDSEWFQRDSNSANPVNTNSVMQPQRLEESDDRTDATLRSISLPNAEHVLTLEKVQEIEKELDDYEIVSLVYLLYDTCELALQDLQLLVVSGNRSDLLYKWAISEEHNNKKWHVKMVEALCIIQNYQILKKYGFAKQDLKDRYMPHRAETTWFVNRTRKTFYLIAEKLGKEQTSRFIQIMGNKIRDKNIPVRGYPEDYLELYLLYWEQIHLDIEDVKNTFKIMDLEQYYDMLNSVFLSKRQEGLNTEDDMKPVSSKVLKKTPKTKTRRKSTTRDTTYQQLRSVEDFPVPSLLSTISQEHQNDDLNKYVINPANPGIVLIINQEDFFTEPDPKFKDLLHEDNDKMKLEIRQGTMQDKNKMEEVFRKRGFRIIVRENLPHYEMIKTIKEVVTMVSSESSLIVSVLSHGDNGVVYGANSCKVHVSQIQDIMCKRNKRNLLGKPKVLILQSCQGKQCQKIVEESTDEDEDEENANARDGGNTIPATADLLTFWATIPGFAAIRNVNRGSWLIQELCDEIEQNSSRYHFLDICTRVVNKVTSKEWREKTSTNIMTPMVVTTLRNSFYLPLPGNNR